MMNKETLYIVASLLIVAGLILIVWGLQQENVLWQIGLGAVAVAMAVSFATRWASGEQNTEEE